MISICGGEPLIYPEIEALVDGLLEQKRIVYICTNAMVHAEEDAGIPRARSPFGCRTPWRKASKCC